MSFTNALKLKLEERRKEGKEGKAEKEEGGRGREEMKEEGKERGSLNLFPLQAPSSLPSSWAVVRFAQVVTISQASASSSALCDFGVFVILLLVYNIKNNQILKPKHAR